MLSTINNLSRNSDKYGNQHFISFLSAILSRLAYLNDNKFLTSYNSIMGPVVVPKIMEKLNGVPYNNLNLLLDDKTLFGLNKDANDIFKDYEYQFNNSNYIDYIKLNMPQNVNIINGDIAGAVNIPVPFNEYVTPSDSVKYISIGWSNYGEIYVVADKRMPNTIFLLFRGTYSGKTASLYSKPTSIVPLTACEQPNSQEKFLYGIFKVSSEMIHTIIETIRYLATSFLGATQPNSVKIFTTGHSLGGAMCTDFAYLWMGVKKRPEYNTKEYAVISNNIICISLGAPRCMNVNVANNFCNFVKEKKILYLRITTNGDPVPALPPAISSTSGFIHPCSNDENMRKIISEACASQLTMRPTPNINYSGNIDCLNYKARVYAPNPLSHTVYLDILFTKAVDIVNFLKGIGMAKEVLRTQTKSTVCRLVMGNSNIYKAIFFDVNLTRSSPNNTDAIEDEELSKPLQTTGGFFSSITKPTAPSSMYNKMTLSVPSIKFGGRVAEDVGQVGKNSSHLPLDFFSRIIGLHSFD